MAQQNNNDNFFQRLNEGGQLGEVTARVTIQRQTIVELSTGLVAAGVIIILFYFSFKRATNS
jgi:hypothetical protein